MYSVSKRKLFPVPAEAWRKNRCARSFAAMPSVISRCTRHWSVETPPSPRNRCSSVSRAASSDYQWCAAVARACDFNEFIICYLLFLIVVKTTINIEHKNTY